MDKATVYERLKLHMEGEAEKAIEQYDKTQRPMWLTIYNVLVDLLDQAKEWEETPG